MGIGVVSRSFCAVCGTGSHALENCPGGLHATGADRPGWHVRVETPRGSEEIGVLLAPTHDRWLARIMTYPNVLWSAPGRTGALKFVGETPDEAEAQAIAFVELHLKARRRAAGASRTRFAAALRKSKSLPVRLRLDRVITRGVTVNLSVEGMFVGVASPADCGRSVLIHLDLDGHTLPLRGLVMWSRASAQPAHPVGMGIRLSDPTPLYQSFVAGLPSA